MSDTFQGILDFAVITVVNGAQAFQLFGGVGTGDPRLSDARVPLAHKHPEADVIGLVQDLAADEKIVNKNQANGYAGLGSNGLVLTQTLGAGTASTATFLRGDQSWNRINYNAIMVDSKGNIMTDDRGNVMTNE